MITGRNVYACIIDENASPRGFEPLASGLGILRSILLSYGDWLQQLVTAILNNDGLYFTLNFNRLAK